VNYRIQLIGPPRLRTPLGDLSPSKPHVFGAALYLGLRRGATVHRSQLSTLLWPDADDRVRGERLRWLLSRLRRHGVAPPLRTADLGLDRLDVHFDVDELLSAESAATAVAIAQGDVLDGYAPQISDGFSRWLEDARTSQRAVVVSALEEWSAASRRNSDLTGLAAVARRILQLDPSHAPALKDLLDSVARTEWHGVSQNAHRGGGSTHAPMRSSGPHASVSGVTQSSLVGRSDTLSHLLTGLTPNPTGHRIGIAGPAGIGKSRILDEFFRRARAQGAQVAHERCNRGDFLRPLSLVANLAHTLTRLRGALGADPDSVAVLQRFLGNAKARLAALTDAEHRGAVIAALSDVVAAISEDGPIVIAIDDGQWAESASWSMLAHLFAALPVAAGVCVIALHADTEEDAAKVYRQAFPTDNAISEMGVDTLWLSPLSEEEIRMLCIARAEPRAVPSTILDTLARRAGGIPLVAEALVDRWLELDDVAALPPLVSRLVSARLDRLSPSAYGVLETIAVLGPDADLRAVEWVSLLDRTSILAATRELETTGIACFSESTISARALWADAVVQRAPTSTQRLLHQYAAEWLQHVTATQGPYDHRRHLAIAAHWLEAGDPVRAQHSLSGGAETLAASSFVNEAAAMTDAAEIAGPLDWRTSALGRLDRHVVRT